MDEQLSSPEVALKLLRIWLNNDLKQRENIATKLNEHVGDLASVNLHLGILQKRINENKQLEIEGVENLMLLLAKVQDELRSIHAWAFPSLIYILGLLSPIKWFITECEEKYKTTIDYSSLITDPINYKTLVEIGIYKTCTALIEYLCLSGCTKVLFAVTLKKNKLEFEVSAMFLNKPDKLAKELKDKLQLIKGLLVWHEAEIFPVTNWQDTYKFSFDLGK